MRNAYRRTPPLQLVILLTPKLLIIVFSTGPSHFYCLFHPSSFHPQATYLITSFMTHYYKVSTLDSASSHYPLVLKRALLIPTTLHFQGNNTSLAVCVTITSSSRRIRSQRGAILCEQAYFTFTGHGNTPLSTILPADFHPSSHTTHDSYQNELIRRNYFPTGHRLGGPIPPSIRYSLR